MKVTWQRLDAILERQFERLGIDAATGSACEALTRRSAAVNEIGDRPGSGEAEQPVAFAQDGEGTAAQTELEKEATTEAAAKLEVTNAYDPTRIAPRVMPASQVRTATSMDMTTAYRRNRSDAPRSAVVISMLVWKENHASSPTRRVAR